MGQLIVNYYIYLIGEFMIKFFNRLTKEKQEFVPHNPEFVTMYSCGPTVYSFQHIGNMRAYVFMDFIRRTLRYNGYKIKGAMNITDVGHLTSDEDEGEDKMLVASQREKKSPWEIAEFYSNIFFDDIKKLNIETPEYVLKATDHVNQMIEYVKQLVEAGFAYETSKGIYFDVQKFPEYGRLSGIKLEDRKAGARIEVDEEKKHPADFAVWIKAPKEHIMQWQSPWGMGYPGWHIECSVMGQEYLGKHIDIHTGGIDHVTVHHENEIAQNDCLADHEVVSFWMELEFLQIDGGKMSKSLGNIYTLDDLAKRGFFALDLRYFFLTAHYSKMQNFTFEALQSAKQAKENLVKLLKAHYEAEEKEIDLTEFKNKFLAAINDDLNMPLALGVLWEMLKQNKNKAVYNQALLFDEVLGLNLKQEVETIEKHEVPTEVEELAKERWQAKQDKNFAKADEMRKQLFEMGYVVKDSKEGYVIEKV
jgi:cysteinyl-tRNA synthetase